MTESLGAAVRMTGLGVASGVVEAGRVEGLRVEATRLIRRFEDGHRSEDYWHFEHPEKGVPVLYRIHNLEKQGSGRFAEMFVDELLHKLASNVLGTTARSAVAAMIVKVPGLADAVPWHRDRTNVGVGQVVNLSLFLDDSMPENGCLEIIPGSHRLAGDEDVGDIVQRGPVHVVPARAGDVVVHDVRLVHGSRRNLTSTFRRSVVIEFAPVGFNLAGED